MFCSGSESLLIILLSLSFSFFESYLFHNFNGQTFSCIEKNALYNIKYTHFFNHHGPLYSESLIDKQGNFLGACDRRQSISALIWLLCPTSFSKSSQAEINVKGAAELDLEYYIKDIFNKNIPSSPMKRLRKMPPARKLDPVFASGLEDVTLQAIAGQSGISTRELQAQMDELQEKAQFFFQKRAFFQPDDVSDQYRFDMFSYVQYKVAMRTIESPIKRAVLIENVGKGVLELIKTMPDSCMKKTKAYDASSGDLKAALQDMEELLKEFQRVNFVESFKVDVPEDVDSDWNDGFTVSVLVTVVRPATLGASLRFNGEEMLFHPDYVASTLKQFLKNYQINSKYLEYYVDDRYRPDPSDFQASEVLIELSLEKD